MGKLLNKDDILKANDVHFEYEEVPEWGGTVKLYAMCLRDRLAFEAIQAESKKEEPDGINIEEILFILEKTIRDEGGKQLFTKEEVSSLLDKSTKVIYRLFGRCAEVNKIAAGDKKTKEKN